MQKFVFQISCRQAAYLPSLFSTYSQLSKSRKKQFPKQLFQRILHGTEVYRKENNRSASRMRETCPNVQFLCLFSCVKDLSSPEGDTSHHFETDPLLRERSFGCYEGQPLSTLKSKAKAEGFCCQSFDECFEYFTRS